VADARITSIIILTYMMPIDQASTNYRVFVYNK